MTRCFFPCGGGPNNFSTSSVHTLVNNPAATSTAYATLQDAWMAWDKSQGQVMTGLINRRAAEWKLYSEADYTPW